MHLCIDRQASASSAHDQSGLSQAIAALVRIFTTQWDAPIVLCARSTTAPLTDLYCSARRPLRKHTTLLYHSLPSTGTTTQDKQHRALLRPFDLGATLRVSSYLNSLLPKNHTQALPKLFKPSFLQEAPISEPDKEEKIASQIHRKHQEKAS